MKKIKILQFPIANSFGGITHYALDNWRLMNKDLFQCDFATMSKKLDFAEEVLETGSKIHYISCYAEDNEEQFIKEVNEILDEGYDVVHLLTKQWKSFMMEEICLKRNVPKVIVHSQSTKCDANDEKKRTWETKEHYRVRALFNENMATDFWACSEEAADWLFGDRIPKEKICIMNNAVETEKFLYNENVRKKLRSDYDVENNFVIGNVGRLVYQKNQKFLIDVFEDVYRNKKDAVLFIIGDGELKEELEQQVRDRNLEGVVRFLGTRNDLDKLYQMFDLFVLPSNFEGVPISLSEAQAAGLKCMCGTNIPSVANITGNVTFVDLEKDKWVVEMEKQVSFYERKDMSSVIKEKGYDLKKQVEYIEQKYMESLQERNL